MKKVLLGLAVLVAMVSCGGNTEVVEAKEVSAHNVNEVEQVDAAVYHIDAGTSVVKWDGKKLAYGHHGVIAIQTGEVKVSEGKITSATVTIDMSTIEETDNKDAKKAADLASHLKNADFFNVDSFPTAKVLVTKVEGGIVNADLTIKGITKAIQFPAVIVVNEADLSVAAKFTINRTDWGVVYGSGSFMDLAKDKAIDDLISFDINVIAKK